MIYRTLGRTGEKVSLVGLGGAHIGKQADEQESIRIIRSALDHVYHATGRRVRDLPVTTDKLL